jgi:hypothetical protein
MTMSGTPNQQVTIENMPVEALLACAFRRFSMISSARMLRGTAGHSITVWPFEQTHSFGDLVVAVIIGVGGCTWATSGMFDSGVVSRHSFNEIKDKYKYIDKMQ